MSALNKVLDQYKISRTEGSKGVENFAKLCRLLGYEDFQSYGMLANGAAYGDIFTFLEDNPGAITALHEWIADQYESELEELAEEDKDEDDEEDPTMPIDQAEDEDES